MNERAQGSPNRRVFQQRGRGEHECLFFPKAVCCTQGEKRRVDDGEPQCSLVSSTTASIDMNTVMAEELRSISGAEREQAYEELHGVFTGSHYATFEETPELVETSLQLLALELDRIPLRHKRAYNRAIFLRPSLTRDRSTALMFLRADRFHVAAAAQRICRFYEEKLCLFGDAKLTSSITLQDLTDDDISSIFNGAGHLLPQKDRSGRMVFFADYLFLDDQDWTNVNRMCWYLALSMVEQDEEVQKQGLVEVFFANGALRQQSNIAKHLKEGFTGLLCLPIRFVGIHFCYDDAVFQPILQLAQLVFGASNRLRFRSHQGSPMELRYALLAYGIVLPMELFDRDMMFKRNLNESFLESRRRQEAAAAASQRSTNTSLVSFPSQNDVLLGKGRSCQEFAGNVQLNRMIDRRLDDYLSLEKVGKSGLAMQLASQIVDENKGRFLERIEHLGWKVVHDKTIIRNKITQAFRARNRIVAPIHSQTNGEIILGTHVDISNEKDDTEQKRPNGHKKARLET